MDSMYSSYLKQRHNLVIFFLLKKYMKMRIGYWNPRCLFVFSLHFPHIFTMILLPLLFDYCIHTSTYSYSCCDIEFHLVAQSHTLLNLHADESGTDIQLTSNSLFSVCKQLWNILKCPHHQCVLLSFRHLCYYGADIQSRCTANCQNKNNEGIC